MSLVAQVPADLGSGAGGEVVVQSGNDPVGFVDVLS